MRQFVSQHRIWLVRFAKLAILALLAWGVRGTLLAAFHKLNQQGFRELIDWQPAWLCAAGGLYLLGILPCGMFWQRLLRAVGQENSLFQTVRAYYIGHLGKYIPGKAMVIVLRTGLLPRQAPLTAITVTIVFETLTMMAVGAGLGVCVLAFAGTSSSSRQGWWLLIALAMAAAAALPTFPPVFRWLLWQLRIGRKNPADLERLVGLGYGSLALGWSGIAVGWAITGTSLWATVRGLGHEAGPFVESLPVYTAAVALATVAGFLSFLPGGAVVRELALTELLVLSGGLDQSLALLAALAWRLAGLVAELIISVILYLAGWRTRK
ncbi:MAG: lysylphosphatidylglycerol synthase domain-containing protein [Pirellulales bacterium]